jgi:uncharacterized protein (DUF1697 family)
MPRYVALLRGINVGGKHSVKMADLKRLFAEAGAADVATYIQSGNVVFTHAAAAKALTADLEDRIRALAGFDVPVALRTEAQLAKVLDRNPFPDVEPTKNSVAFLAAKPAAADVKAFDGDRFAPEQAVVDGLEVYLHLPEGTGRAKLPPTLAKLGVPATIRNRRTIEKLLEMLAAS